jgi:hypothetical protein
VALLVVLGPEDCMGLQKEETNAESGSRGEGLDESDRGAAGLGEGEEGKASSKEGARGRLWRGREGGLPWGSLLLFVCVTVFWGACLVAASDVMVRAYPGQQCLLPQQLLLPPAVCGQSDGSGSRSGSCSSGGVASSGGSRCSGGSCEDGGPLEDTRVCCSSGGVGGGPGGCGEGDSCSAGRGRGGRGEVLGEGKASGWGQAEVNWGRGGGCWATSVFRLHVLMEDLTPNIGQMWYFFTELFSDFRPFFRWVLEWGGGARVNVCMCVRLCV